MRGKEAIEALSRLVFWAFDRANAPKNARKCELCDVPEEDLIEKLLEEACEVAEAAREDTLSATDFMREAGDLALVLGELTRRKEIMS